MKLSFVFLLLAFKCFSQSINKPIESEYDFVDSVVLKQGKKILVGFQNTENHDESLIKYINNGQTYYFIGVLSCYDCKGYGATGYTYTGHIVSNNTIIFIEDYYNSTDSIFIDFSGKTPYYKKISHIYFLRADAKIQASFRKDNFYLIPKSKIAIDKYKLPIDIDEPKAKSDFIVKHYKE